MQLVIENLREKLTTHRVYSLITTVPALRIFMEAHVVAVWDFMSLVKSLQFSICSRQLPWVPPVNRRAARLINEIVMTEESDCVGGNYKSHFELYVEAMQQVGCDLRPIQLLVEQAQKLSPHDPYEKCFKGISLPAGAERFLRTTFAVLHQPLAVQAAVFFHARENIIPAMFRTMVKALAKQGFSCSILIDYLERHVQIDGELHGPMAAGLLAELYGESQTLKDAAEAQAVVALEARLALWEAIADRLESDLHGQRIRSDRGSYQGFTPTE